MAGRLLHRGPDDSGVWFDDSAGIGIGFRRLIVIDPSPTGHQPMVSPGGRYVLAFNGEIYNFRSLRVELEGLHVPFRGSSDSEVLVAAVEQWGLAATLRRANGMFAFAVWDRQRRELSLARDRLGEKPLYYGWNGDTFLFGSELKALCAHPDFHAELDRGALSLYMRHAYVPAPYSIYRGIRKLLPGAVARLRLDDRPGTREPEVSRYWSFADAASTGSSHPLMVSLDEATDQLDDLLRDSVRMRMVADVPVGAFLSGGIDSSTVVALMQATSTSRVRTFTIGFHQEQYDEAQHAKAVAGHLGTDHTELYVPADVAIGVVPELAGIYDEPFADPSQIPTVLVSRLARTDVTVALSGDGGDELFGGYGRYFVYRSLRRKVDVLPSVIRRAGARAVTSVSPAGWDAVWHRVGPVLPSWARNVQAGDKAYRLARILRAGPGESYRDLMSYWSPADVVRDGHEPATAFDDRDLVASHPGPVQAAMAVDTVSYLPDDILVKLDRASMSTSLEARVPLLDHRVVELAWRFPLHVKVAGATGKLALRRVLSRYVPNGLVDRPKMGFGAPIGDWLRGPMGPWAEQLLDPMRLDDEGYLRSRPVRQLWDQHRSGERNWQYLLWSVLMFEEWLSHAPHRHGAGEHLYPGPGRKHG